MPVMVRILAQYGRGVDTETLDTFEFAVVGAGVNGLAVARELAQGGRSVALIEQFDLDHARGSSHGDSRTFRTYSDPVWFGEWRVAERLWNELETETGSRLTRKVGLLCYGDQKGVDVRAESAHLAALGVPIEMLDAHEVRTRFESNFPRTGTFHSTQPPGSSLLQKLGEHSRHLAAREASIFQRTSGGRAGIGGGRCRAAHRP